ncbi:uncharacterized protein [Alexandromys fortis]|uniref:uncharacterized protein isoform X2 n=1 Tax=Alexandromys fortis TaxID=100897 RepID=UPI002152FF08|nr:uncharacterized protein LOC126509780 isoform X2 [Microtus fortis]
MTLNSYFFEDEKEENSKPIGRYPIPYKKDLPFDIVELMEEMERKTGFLPNVFKVLSYRPLEFRAFFAYYNAIYNKETGRLSKADKELIIVVTSLGDKCLYSVVVHSAMYRVYSKNPGLSDQRWPWALGQSAYLSGMGSVLSSPRLIVKLVLFPQSV